MSKKIDFSILSDKQCNEPECRTNLKQNLVDRSPTASKCYFHYMKLVRVHPDYKEASNPSAAARATARRRENERRNP